MSKAPSPSRYLFDGQQAYSVNAAQFDILLPVAPGSHTASVTFRSVNENSQTSQQTFTVKASATCPLNVISPSLTICSPLNAAVVKGSVTFNIQANDPNPPKNVYLDVDASLRRRCPIKTAHIPTARPWPLDRIPVRFMARTLTTIHLRAPRSSLSLSEFLGKA